jgi:hypothetical protein
MTTLKAFLDKLAGPDHPFTQGAPVEGLSKLHQTDERDRKKKRQAAEGEVKLNKFLRVNTN